MTQEISSPVGAHLPLLTAIVPSYNSQDYLSRALRTLTGYGDLVEVIIVNDGSQDQTAQIADDWAAKMPDTIRVIHQVNKGHGGALNAGIAAARGRYVKIVDSDDWVSRQAMWSVLAEIQAADAQGETLDLIVTNYVYEKQGRSRKVAIRFSSILPEGQTVGWESLRKPSYTQYLMMHALTLRTQVLRDSGVMLPEKTFYVDFLYSFVPLPYVKTIRYIDVDLYRYFTGREDQSVNEKIMVTRTDQLLRVNAGMVEAMPEAHEVCPELYHYMLHYLRINTVSTLIMLALAGGEEHLAQYEAFWPTLDASRPNIARDLRRGALGRAMMIPGEAGRRAIIGGYHMVTRVLGLS